MRWPILAFILVSSAFHLGGAVDSSDWKTILIPKGEAGVVFYGLLPVGLLVASAFSRRMDGVLLTMLAIHFLVVAMQDFGVIRFSPFERTLQAPAFMALMGCAYTAAVIPYKVRSPRIWFQDGRSIAGFWITCAGNVVMACGLWIFMNLPLAAGWIVSDRLPTMFRGLVAVVFALTLIAVTAAVLPFTAVEVRRHGRRLSSAPARWVMERDRRPPVLVLRPFLDDPLHRTDAQQDIFGLLGGLSFLFRPTQSLEQVIVDSTSRFGPVLALSRPGDRVLSEAITRLEVTHDQWRGTVLELAGGAWMICFIVGESVGLTWELEELVARGLRERLCFIVPPYSVPSHKRGEHESGSAFEEAFDRLIGSRLPSRQIGRGEHLVAIRVGEESLLEYVARARNVDSDRRVLRRVALDIRRAPTGPAGDS